MRRWTWLVLIPTTCALLPWFFPLPTDPADNHVPAGWLLIDGSLPLIGLLAILAFRVRHSVVSPLLPQFPFAIAAISYLGTSVLLSINNDDSIRWVSYVFLVSITCFVLQPVLAAIGGFACARALDRRAR